MPLVPELLLPDVPGDVVVDVSEPEVPDVPGIDPLDEPLPEVPDVELSVLDEPEVELPEP